MTRWLPPEVVDLRREAEARAGAIEDEFDGVTAVPWERRGSVGVAADWPGGHLIGGYEEVRAALEARDASP